MTPTTQEIARGPLVANGRSVPVAGAAPARTPSTLRFRTTGFLLLVTVSLAWLWQPLATVIVVSLRHGEYEHYSHIVLIPLAAAGLIYLRRVEIFAHVASAPGWGGLLMGIGIALSVAARTGPITQPDQVFVSLAMLALVVLCAGAFLLCYGVGALRAASFPVALLLFMVPIPPVLLHRVIVSLQIASAEVTYWLFGLLGVPVYREGFFFALPGIGIEIAEECSGIRSFLALVITGTVAGHLLLRTTWTRAGLVLAILPIAIVKNAVRIVVLSLLAIHFDKGFITGGALHRYGGIPLFFVTLVLVGGLVYLLQRSEGRPGGRATSS
jgi:exosortase